MRSIDLPGRAAAGGSDRAAVHTGAARHLKLVESDLAVALSMSVGHKNIFFDRNPAQLPEG